MGKYSKDKRDIYYRKAKELGFRARSAFKLLQIDEEFDIFRDVHHAVDLCAAPGSWSQVLSRKLLADKSAADAVDAKIVAVDLQPMAPIQGVVQIEGDITSSETAQQIIAAFGGQKADLVVCDGAPDVTGLHDIDEYVQSQLIVSALSITSLLLKNGGTFICKIFRGRDVNVLYNKLEVLFNDLAVAKPKSSRNSSIEAFVVCRGFHSRSRASAHSLDGDMLRHFGPHKTIRFVACGDLSAYDADANYPLMDEDYVAPVQPPTNPNYKEFMALKQDQVFDHKVVVEEQDDVIHAVDTVPSVQPYPPLKSWSSKNAKRRRPKSRAHRSAKSADRERKRNKVVLYGSMIGAAAVLLYLTKFYYSTHQTEDGPHPDAAAPAKTPNIDFRKQ